MKTISDLSPREREILSLLNSKLNLRIAEKELTLNYNVEQAVKSATILTRQELHVLGIAARSLDKIQLKVFGRRHLVAPLTAIKKKKAGAYISDFGFV